MPDDKRDLAKKIVLREDRRRQQQQPSQQQPPPQQQAPQSQRGTSEKTYPFSPGVKQDVPVRQKEFSAAMTKFPAQVAASVQRGTSALTRNTAYTHTPEDSVTRVMREETGVLANAALPYVRDYLKKKTAARRIARTADPALTPPDGEHTASARSQAAASHSETARPAGHSAMRERAAPPHANPAANRTAQNGKQTAQSMSAAPAAQDTPVRFSPGVKQGGAVYQHRKVAGTDKAANVLSHGTPATSHRMKTAPDTVRAWHTTGNALSRPARTPKSQATAIIRTKQAAKAAQPVKKMGQLVKEKARRKMVIATLRKIGQAVAGAVRIVAALLGAIPLLIVFLVIIVVVAILTSPIGTLLTGGNEDNPVQIDQMTARIGRQWADSLTAERQRYEDAGYVVSVEYGEVGVGDMPGRVNNWKDCLALYIVSMYRQPEPSLALLPQDEPKVRDLYFAMNPISTQTRVEIVESQVETERIVENRTWDPTTNRWVSVQSTQTVTETVQEEVKYADINVLNLRWIQMLDRYPLADPEQGYVKFLLKSEHNPLWEALGIYNSILPGGGFSGDISDIIRNLPPGQLGSAIVELALSRMGDPYLLGGRQGPGGYIDCSGLTMWAYAQAGISIPGTAAEQARWCVDNGLVIDPAAAVPGDLIFWSYANSSRVSDRFMAIGHVAVYAGDGMMVEAAPSAGGVTYRAVSVQGTPVLWGRAHLT